MAFSFVFLGIKQAQLGVPHSRIQVELGFILQARTCQIPNFAQNPRQSQSVQGTELNWGRVDTTQKKCIPGGWTPHIFSESKMEPSVAILHFGVPLVF